MADFVVREYDNHIAVMHSGCNQPSIFCEASFFGPTRQSDAEAYAKTLNERAAAEGCRHINTERDIFFLEECYREGVVQRPGFERVLIRVVLDLYRKANP